MRSILSLWSSLLVRVSFLFVMISQISGPGPGKFRPLDWPRFNPDETGPIAVYLPVILHIQARQRVNVPYFEGDIVPSQSAVFWFGQVDSIQNYADVRVGYNSSELYLLVQVVDRRLWYDPSPSPTDLSAWDAISLFLDLQGGSGDAPHTGTYQFVGQLNWWEPHEDWQAGYRGNGTTWVEDPIFFTTTIGWRGNEPNDDVDDRGWTLAFRIPFSSLGMVDPPARGSKWGIGFVLHDRDDAQGTLIPEKRWPSAMQTNRPASWGILSFGLPDYTISPVIPVDTSTIRQGLNGAIVPDVHVGGHTVCGSKYSPDYFDGWGEANYAGYNLVNIQNQMDIADWPCFSKYYVRFPLSAIPRGKVIISATLRLYQWGNAGMGYEPGPHPSLIQAYTIQENWEESTITWNNAPQAWENISQTWAYPMDKYPYPGIPLDFDVSRAAAAAYASGEPLMLALYSADGPYHSGKYFHSSDAADWYAEGRPTLLVTWGE